MRKIALLAALLVAAVATTAAPAVGGNHAATATCWTAADAASFDSLASLTSAGAALRGTGAIAKEPSLNETYEALPAEATGQGGKKFRATVPVYFHVITDGATGNLTDRQVRNQLTILNMAFSGFYGGANSGFTFELKAITRTNNAEWFNAQAGTYPERDMKSTLRQGGFESLNVYSNLAGGYLGYAYLPGLPDSRLSIDGVVLHYGSVPGSNMFVGRYDLGMTLVHEVGHWVNLEHTFFGGCNAKGDFVEDTPAMLVPTSGCPDNKDTCPKEPGLDPIHNYMDYSYDSCYNQFTPGQVARAQDSWLYFRAA
jgi:hypothetical protein